MNFEVPQISDWNIYRKVHGPSLRSAELSSPYVVVNNGHPTHFWIFLSIWLLTHFWFTVNLSHFFYPFLSNSLEIRIWNLGSIFEFAWVFHSQNHPVFILLHWSFLYIKWGVLIWFLLNPRNFNPRNFQFLVFFHSKPLFLCRTLWRHWYQKIRILLRIF